MKSEDSKSDRQDSTALVSEKSTTLTAPDPTEDNNLLVHKYFRGSGELAGFCKGTALVTELITIVIATHALLTGNSFFGKITPLVVVVMLFLSLVFRIWSKHIHGFAQKCRRLSIRHYSSGELIDDSIISSLESDAPWGAIWFSNYLPAKNFEEYYLNEKDPGSQKLQENYSHSAFFTWRILRLTSWMLISCSILFAIGGFIMIYSLVIEQTDIVRAVNLLDIVCSIVFGVLVFRTLESGVTNLMAYKSVKSIYSDLVKEKSVERIKDLCTDYDMELNGGPAVPTLLYFLMRKGLEKKWLIHRRQLAYDPKLLKSE